MISIFGDHSPPDWTEKRSIGEKDRFWLDVIGQLVRFNTRTAEFSNTTRTAAWDIFVPLKKNVVFDLVRYN